MEQTTFILIGAAILDVLARPVSTEVFRTGSLPADTLTVHTGGDAMNEARTLASLGGRVRLVTRLGEDPAGDLILTQCSRLGIDTSFICRNASVPTGINVVLVDESGERHFITSPHGTLRRFFPEDIPGNALSGGKYFCFASIFVAPAFNCSALASLFRIARKQGLVICADMTRCKNGETAEDMRECLSCLDYIFPNYEEAALLTGKSDWDDIADVLLDCGVRHVILKAGSEGCFIKTASERFWIPACSDIRCVDTTGAGDTFTACFLYALNSGFSLPDCGRFANAGASFCIEQTGAAGAGCDVTAILKRAGLDGGY